MAREAGLRECGAAELRANVSRERLDTPEFNDGTRIGNGDHAERTGSFFEAFKRSESLKVQEGQSR